MSEETQECGVDRKEKKGCFGRLKCRLDCVRVLAYIANVILVIVACFALAESYGAGTYLSMLLFVPPLLSIWALRKQGDREELDLKKRIRKAYLRKELKALSEFDA